MNIIYRKNTLYVYLRERIDDKLIDTIENRINNIMKTYDITNLVIRTNGQDISSLRLFESRFNSTHESRVLIK